MAVIKAKKIPVKIVTSEEVLYTFCCYFPQYTFAQARQLPYKRVKGMLKAARKQQAKKMIDLFQVLVFSQSKNGRSGVLSYFKKDLED